MEKWQSSDEPVVKLSLICEPRPDFVKIADEHGCEEVKLGLLALEAF